MSLEKNLEILESEADLHLMPRFIVSGNLTPHHPYA